MSDTWDCLSCKKKFPSLRKLNEHRKTVKQKDGIYVFVHKKCGPRRSFSGVSKYVRERLPDTHFVLDEVQAERERQDVKWGQQNHPDLCPVLTKRKGGASPERFAEDLGILTASQAKFRCEGAANEKRSNWASIFVEELAEAVEQAALKNKKELRKELVQCAAVLVAWIQAIDRRSK